MPPIVLIVIAVFFPVFTLEGLSGAFFRPLALSYVVAIVASLLVALTVTPAMSLLLLTGRGARTTEPKLVTRLNTAITGCCRASSIDLRSLVAFLRASSRPRRRRCRSSAKEVLTGASATVVVRIFGPDVERLQSHAATVKKALEGSRAPLISRCNRRCWCRRSRCSSARRSLGPTAWAPGDVRRAVTTLVHGARVGEFYDQQRVFAVVVRGAPELRETPEAIRALRVPVPGGGDRPGHEIEHPLAVVILGGLVTSTILNLLLLPLYLRFRGTAGDASERAGRTTALPK
jgi:Cu/Ag efflux pump CusA